MDPRGLGRHRKDLVALARRIGINIVSATGRHRAIHYRHEEATHTADMLAQQFVSDIQNPDHPCGLIKIGTGFHHLDACSRTCGAGGQRFLQSFRSMLAMTIC
jgi:predicted metal-dependent phosphotriesterase family hydrolase